MLAIPVPRYYPGCNFDYPFFDDTIQNCTKTCAQNEQIPITNISLTTDFRCLRTECPKSVAILISPNLWLFFCVECNGQTPYFDTTIMACVSQCNSDKQYINNQDICLQYCDRDPQNQLMHFDQYQWNKTTCNNCFNNGMYNNTDSCVNSCPLVDNQYQLISFNTKRCLTECNGLISPFDATNTLQRWCISCPFITPFYDPVTKKCTDKCPQAVNDQGICVLCPDHMMLNPVIDPKSGLPVNKCQETCDTGKQINRTCQSCINISMAATLFDPETKSCVSECSTKYNYNNQLINLVDQNMVCTATNQNYIKLINTYGTTEIYQTYMYPYSFKQALLNGGWPTVLDCDNFRDDWRCVNKCPQQINGYNVVDINKQCLNQTERGYLQNSTDNMYRIFHPYCNQYLNILNNYTEVKCLNTCQKYVRDTIGQNICLDNFPCATKIRITQSDQFLPQLVCSSDVPEGFIEILDNVFVQEVNCYDYFINRCNNNMISAGCNNKYQDQGSIKCQSSCSTKFINNYTCVDSCKKQNPSLVVSSNGTECAAQCQRYDVLNSTQDEDYCTACDTYLTDQNKCVKECPTERPFNDFGLCGTACTNQSAPYKLIYNTTNCTEKCDNYIVLGNFNNMTIHYCIGNCNDSMYKFVKSDGSRICVASCEQHEITLTGNVCFQCKDQEPYKLDNMCVSSCAERSLLVQDGECVTGCSAGRQKRQSGIETICVIVNRSLVAPLTGGIIGGICIAVLIALIVLGVLGKLTCCRKKNQLKGPENDDGKSPGEVSVAVSNLIKSSALQNSQNESRVNVKSRHLTPLPETNHSTTNFDTHEEPNPAPQPVQRRRRRARKIRTEEQLINDSEMPFSPV